MALISMRQLLDHADIRMAITGAMRRAMSEDRSAFDPRCFLKAARAATKNLCQTRYVESGSAGWAGKIKPIPLEKMAAGYGY